MDIVTKLLNVAKLKGVERDEYLKKHFGNLDESATLFVSFVLGTKLKKLKIQGCTNTPIYLGKEHFMYNYLNFNKIHVEYLSPNEVNVINILKRNRSIPHTDLLSHLSYVFSMQSLNEKIMDTVLNAKVELKGISENSMLHHAYMSSKGSLITSKGTTPPIPLKPLDCVIYTKKRQKIIAHGGSLLYAWLRLGKRILPPDILKLHNKHTRSYKGLYDFTLTFAGVESKYIALTKVECNVTDWIIDDELFVPLGVRFDTPNGIKIKSNEIYFKKGEEVKELSSYKVYLYVNESNKVKRVQLMN